MTERRADVPPNENETPMKFWKRATAIVFVMLVGGLSTAQADIAENDAAQRLDDATSVLQQFVNIPENAVPQALLRQAYGIAVIPSVFKISFLGGVQRGKGVLAVRTGKGDWSDPAFITLTGGSVGFQAGVSSTDIILVFKTQRSVDRIANGQFSLGGDASVAAGPVGRSVGASTNMSFNAEVYSYSRSRGLFGGVSLGGARLGIDQDANWLFYDKPGIDARTLLRRDSGQSLPKAGQRFVYTLNQYMPASSDKFNYDSNTSAGSNSGETYSSGSNASGSGQRSDAMSSGETQPYNSNAAGNGITVQQGAGGSGYQGSGATSDYTGDSDSYRSAGQSQ
ncbi:lipid-binding SYLF domain-containing protein [uncultured Salinisphaera sp.]|uniref:lipid-binding SYLF domain-containing protein n=1 Tax=uncultured Salinisphaera sp. TaxID=359372 RepID=UPI0032B237AC|tara:strand:+ start:5446 stop:6459 length:1014 start_codon:yes stop_codon:yes gene_type:complete